VFRRLSSWKHSTLDNNRSPVIRKLRPNRPRNGPAPGGPPGHEHVGKTTGTDPDERRGEPESRRPSRDLRNAEPEGGEDSGLNEATGDGPGNDFHRSCGADSIRRKPTGGDKPRPYWFPLKAQAWPTHSKAPTRPPTRPLLHTPTPRRSGRRPAAPGRMKRRPAAASSPPAAAKGKRVKEQSVTMTGPGGSRVGCRGCRARCGGGPPSGSSGRGRPTRRRE